MPELHAFQKLNQEAFSELLRITLKSLAQKQQPSELTTVYQSACSKSQIEFAEIEPALKRLQQVCADAVKKSKTSSQINGELLHLGMNEDHVQLFLKQWEKIYSSLVQSTVASTIPINPLIDMEWKFGVTSASNQCNTVGNVFLQIKLEVDEGNGRNKSVCFELQLSEFYAFLHEMERARASLDYLS